MTGIGPWAATPPVPRHPTDMDRLKALLQSFGVDFEHGSTFVFIGPEGAKQEGHDSARCDFHFDLLGEFVKVGVWGG